jgi:hypothetical protein
MKKLKFYNLATKKPVLTSNYKTVKKGNRTLAVATDGKTKMYRIV